MDTDINTIEQKIDQVYTDLFDYICEEHDDLHELLIEYKSKSTGKTIRRSWFDREKILKSHEE